MFRQIPVLQTQHRLGVQCCKLSISHVGILHLQHRASCIAEFTASVHRVAFTAWPAHYVAFTASKPSRVYVAMSALRPSLYCIYSIAQGFCWYCSMLGLQHGFAVFTAPQHPSHSYCICNIIVRRDSVWVIGALSQKNKTRSIGIPLPLSLCYRQCGSDGLEYVYT